MRWFAHQYRYELPWNRRDWILAGIVHRLSGPHMHAHTRTSRNRRHSSPSFGSSHSCSYSNLAQSLGWSLVPAIPAVSFAWPFPPRWTWAPKPLARDPSEPVPCLDPGPGSREGPATFSPTSKGPAAIDSRHASSSRAQAEGPWRTLGRLRWCGTELSWAQASAL